MAVTRPNAHVGTAATLASTLTATLPAHAAGDRLLVFVAGKYNTTTVPTCSTSGWTLVKSGTGGTGAAGADTGTVFWTVWAKDATSASETNPVFNAGGTPPDSWVALATGHRPTSGKIWRDAIGADVPWVGGASVTSTASPLTASVPVTNKASAGDQIQTFGITPQDVSTTIGSGTVTATGLSGTSVSISGGYIEAPLGNDCAAVGATWSNFSGTQTGDVVPSFTLTSATNHSGAVVAVVLREQDGVVMNAGPDQVDVEPYTTVTLDASGSSLHTTGTWTQTAGTPTVTLASTSAITTTFEAPGTLDGTTLVFRRTDTPTGLFDDVAVTMLPASRRVKIGGVMVPVKRRVKFP